MEVGWLVSPNPQKRHLLPLYIHPTLPTSPIIISPWHTHTPELPSYLQLKVLQFWQPSAEIEANLIYFAPFSIFVPSPPLRFDSHCSARTFTVHPDFPTTLTGERPSGYFDCYVWTLDFLNWRHADVFCQSLQNRVQTISTVWGVFFCFVYFLFRIMPLVILGCF